MTVLTRRGLGLVAGGALFAPYLLPAARAAADLSKVTLRVGDQVGQQQSKLKAAGLLDHLPYRIEWSVYPAAVHLHEALKAGAIDIGGANDSPTVSAMANGSPAIAVAAWDNGGRGTYLLVPRGSTARTVADLRGKTISPTTRGSVAHHLVVGELGRAGLAAEDVKLAFLNPVDAGAAFAAGSIDAWATWGIYAARVRGVLGGRVLSDGKGINSGLFVYSATGSALRDPGKVAAIADLSERISRGYQWSRDNRAAHIAWFKGFARQDDQIAEALYDDDADHRRIAIDDAFVARLRKTFETWRSAGILGGDIEFGGHVYRELAVGGPA